VKRDQIARAEHWYRAYGRWSLLLSWLPFIGDPLTVVAGVLREPFRVFLALVAAAKTARHFAVTAIAFGWF
jgi:membrane protein YqaA with SNARE-associated domain